jgi:RNA polymerase sigma factor (sigma-70 family)
MADHFAEMGKVAERLVRDLWPSLLRSTQHPDKEDLAQEALTRFFAAKDWTSIPKPKAYVRVIFRHVLFERRQVDARNSIFIPTDDDLLECIVAAGPEAKLSASQEIDAALSGMQETRRNVYMLKALGLSYREIASELNLKLNTVKKYVCQAQQYCRALASHSESGIARRAG